MVPRPGDQASGCPPTTMWSRSRWGLAQRPEGGLGHGKIVLRDIPQRQLLGVLGPALISLLRHRASGARACTPHAPFDKAGTTVRPSTPPLLSFDSRHGWIGSPRWRARVGKPVPSCCCIRSFFSSRGILFPGDETNMCLGMRPHLWGATARFGPCFLVCLL